MKGKNIAVLVVVSLLFVIAVLFISGCTSENATQPIIVGTVGATNNATAEPEKPTSTVVPTKTPVPTVKPSPTATATQTPTVTPVPPLEMVIQAAREQEMLVVILFSPVVYVDRYFNKVQEVEGYTPEQLLGQAYPEVLEKVESESYYKDYFRVIMVGDYNSCFGNICETSLVYEFASVRIGRTISHVVVSPRTEADKHGGVYDVIEYGGVVIHWHKTEEDVCSAGTFLNFCME